MFASFEPILALLHPENTSAEIARERRAIILEDIGIEKKGRVNIITACKTATKLASGFFAESEHYSSSSRTPSARSRFE